MWRLWLMLGQTLGFVAIATPLVWINIQPHEGITLSSLLVATTILSGFIHLSVLEVFFYPEANRSEVAAYARATGGLRYFLGGVVFGAGGVAAGSIVGWGLSQLFTGYWWLTVAIFCPVFAMIAAIAWACQVPADFSEFPQDADSEPAVSDGVTGLPRFPQ